MNLDVETVIGDGSAISLLPLVVDWCVPRNCLMALRGEDCTRPLAYIYVLHEPVEGHKHLGICREHDAELRHGGDDQ